MLYSLGNPYFFRLVWQWWELPDQDSTFPREWCCRVVGAHLAHPTWAILGGGVHLIMYKCLKTRRLIT